MFCHYFRRYFVKHGTHSPGLGMRSSLPLRSYLGNITSCQRKDATIFYSTRFSSLCSFTLFPRWNAASLPRHPEEVKSDGSLYRACSHRMSHSTGSCRAGDSGGGFHITRCGLKDVRRGDRGESHRLTFEERAERRSGKSKELRAEREQHAQELQTMILEEFPQELEELYTRVHRQSSREALKVLNTAKCIEGIEVEVPGQENQSVPLGSVGQLIKLNAQIMELTLPTPALAATALQRISRVDGTWQVTKEANGGNTKIKIVVPPLTTQHREKAAEKIRHYIAVLKQKAKGSRTNMVKLLQRTSSMVEEGVLTELTDSMNASYESFLQEKTEELELLIEELLVSNENTESGDEGDIGVGGISGKEN